MNSTLSRRVVHVRLPRIGIDRHRQANPGLGDGPVVETVLQRGQPVVSQLNRQAAAVGLATGQTLADARAVCPDLRSLVADPQADVRLLHHLAEICRRFAPQIGLDQTTPGLFLDAAGCGHLFGGEEGLVDQLARKLAAVPVEAHLAMADTPGAAWAWSAAGDPAAPVLAPGAHRAALGPLPPAALRLPPEEIVWLERLGIDTIDTLLALPRPALAVRFGVELPACLDRVTGAVFEPLELLPEPRPVRVSLEPAGPAASTEGIQACLEVLLAQLERRLRRDNTGARQLVLALDRLDGCRLHFEVGTAAPTRNGAHLAALFAPRLADMDPGPGIERLQLEATATEPFRETGPDLGIANATPTSDRASLAGLLDRLCSRLGADRVFWPEPRNAHLPEEQFRNRRARDFPKGIRPVSAGGDGPLRPVRYFRRPVSDIRVSDHQGVPECLVQRGISRRIIRDGDVERLRYPWWRGRKDPGAVRECIRVSEESGRRLWLGREVRADRPGPWKVYGLFG